jgi:hypothetical protein
MADFWELSDGDDIAKTGSKFETGGGNLDPIPDKTDCVAVIDEAKIETNQEGLKYISLRWSVVQPSDYKNRKVFQKLWVYDEDPQAKNSVQKKDKAKKMLFAIDANAGGKLKASGKAPSTDLLQSTIMNKPMQIKVMVWEQNGNSGNWISSVAPRAGGAGAMAAAAAPKVAAVTSEEDDGDNIPF